MAEALGARQIEMLRRLVNLRDHTATNINEAATAAAKLQSLLLEYNLEEAQLEQLGGSRPIYGQQDFDVSHGGPKNLCDWKTELLHVISQHNMCRSIHRIDKHAQASPRVSIVGERHNIAVVKGFYDYLSNELIRLGENDWPKYRLQFYNARKRHFLHWFYTGAKNVIDKRLAEQRAADATIHEAQWGLVVIKEGQLQEAYDQLFPDARQGGKSRMSNGDMKLAKVMGMRAAENISLDKQVTPAEQEYALGART